MQPRSFGVGVVGGVALAGALAGAVGQAETGSPPCDFEHYALDLEFIVSSPGVYEAREEHWESTAQLRPAGWASLDGVFLDGYVPDSWFYFVPADTEE